MRDTSGNGSEELRHRFKPKQLDFVGERKTTGTRSLTGSVIDDPVIQAQADAGRTRHLQKEIENFTQQAEICEELASR